MFGRGKKEEIVYRVDPPFDQIPEGWYVRSLCQSPKTFFWSCKIVHTDCFLEEADHIRYVEVNDYEKASEAVQAAINSIKFGGIKRKPINPETCA